MVTLSLCKRARGEGRKQRDLLGKGDVDVPAWVESGGPCKDIR